MHSCVFAAIKKVFVSLLHELHQIHPVIERKKKAVCVDEPPRAGRLTFKWVATMMDQQEDTLLKRQLSVCRCVWMSRGVVLLKRARENVCGRKDGKTHYVKMKMSSQLKRNTKMSLTHPKGQQREIEKDKKDKMREEIRRRMIILLLISCVSNIRGCTLTAINFIICVWGHLLSATWCFNESYSQMSFYPAMQGNCVCVESPMLWQWLPKDPFYKAKQQ